MGKCLNKISGGGGIKRLYTDVSSAESTNTAGTDLESVVGALKGVYDLAGVKRLLSMDIRLPKQPSDKELKRCLNAMVKDGTITKKGKNYFFSQDRTVL